MKTKLITLAAMATLGLVALTGCSASGQSTASACEFVSGELSSIGSDLTEATSGMSEGDFEGAVTAVSEMEARLSAATDIVDNVQVKEAMGELTESVGLFGDLMQKAADAQGDNAKLMALTEELTERYSAIQNSSTKLQDICD